MTSSALNQIAAIADGRAVLGDFALDELTSLLREAKAVLVSKPEAALPWTRPRERLAALRAWADAQPWPGRTGTTDKLAYVALLGCPVPGCGDASALLVP
jgi:hypothetical protein